MWIVRLVMAVALTLSLSFVASTAHAKKAKVDVAAVELTKSVSTTKQRDKQLQTTLRRFAHQAAKHLDFGKVDRVEVTLVVKELSVVESDGLLRVSCTLVGKLKGGGSAKSRLSFGGKPDKKKQLERQVLSSVTDGVMTRLAMLSRERASAGS
ncbi:MAG: hypothetical protein HOW73_21075 [Polyangiaceae bacterium]|nr:hypothetical protein [Polyangiaceae bacterium]